jgi:hypothetical protein
MPDHLLRANRQSPALPEPNRIWETPPDFLAISTIGKE